LTAPVARLFRLMTLVPAPEVGLRALSSLIGLPVRATLTLVEELERTNLVRQNQPRRFHMHGLVRLFAAEVAEQTDTASERDDAVRRMVDHYAWTASAGDQALYPHRASAQWPPPAPGCVPQDFASEAAALDWFDVEHQHVLAVQELALGLGRHDRVWQLARALDTVQYRRGHLHDNVRTAALGVTAADVLGQRERAMAYRQLGRAYTRSGDLENAEKRLRQAFDLCVGDPHGQAHTRHDLARVRSQGGDYAGALEHSTKALELYRAVRDSVGEAHVLNAMGYHLADLGDFDGARSRCQAAVSAQERLGNASGLVGALDNLGSIELRGGQAAEAVEPLERALVMCGELRNTYFKARVAENLGLAYAGTGQRARARNVLRSALDLYEAQYRAADAARVRERLAEA
jgi:tetratricopeptide (TPR) repeat protein